MGALFWPLMVVVGLAILWFVFGATKTRNQAKVEEELPTDPYARRQDEVARLREEHRQADPSLTKHPARRP